jgi:hypothetical protein
MSASLRMSGPSFSKPGSQPVGLPVPWARDRLGSGRQNIQGSSRLVIKGPPNPKHTHTPAGMPTEAPHPQAPTGLHPPPLPRKAKELVTLENLGESGQVLTSAHLGCLLPSHLRSNKGPRELSWASLSPALCNCHLHPTLPSSVHTSPGKSWDPKRLHLGFQVWIRELCLRPLPILTC